MDGWELTRCYQRAMKAAGEALGVGADECRASSRKPTWWSTFKRRRLLPGGWDDLDQREWEDRCIDRHVWVFHNDYRIGEYRCRLQAMEAD